MMDADKFVETAFNGMYPDEEHNVKFVKSGASNLFSGDVFEGCEVGVRRLRIVYQGFE